MKSRLNWKPISSIMLCGALYFCTAAFAQDTNSATNNSANQATAGQANANQAAKKTSSGEDEHPDRDHPDEELAERLPRQRLDRAGAGGVPALVPERDLEGQPGQCQVDHAVDVCVATITTRASTCAGSRAFTRSTASSAPFTTWHRSVRTAAAESWDTASRRLGGSSAAQTARGTPARPASPIAGNELSAGRLSRTSARPAPPG